MRVLHVTRDWVRPSEGFVADVVRASVRTTPHVALGVRHPGPVPPAPTTDLTALARRLPLVGERALRAALRLTVHRRQSRLLHSHFGYWAHLTGPVAAATGCPWTVALHGHDLLVEGDPHGVLPLADRVVVPSQFLAAAAVRVGVRDEQIAVVPSGLDLASLPYAVRRPQPDGSVVVTFAGRFVAKKGVLDAVEALALVHASRPGVTLRFVGHGPLQADLEAALHRLGLSAEVRDGSVPGAVRAALAETDVLLTASKLAPDGDAETLGLVNLEAHALGALVVTTATGGVPEAVAPGSATLVPEGDVRAMARAVLDLLDDPGDWPRRCQGGRAHVERHFLLADRVAELEDLWLGLAGGNRRVGR